MMPINDFVKMASDTSGYPTLEWDRQSTVYQSAWDHFTGAWLSETVSTTSNSLKYPLGLNVFRIPAQMHVSFLFGEIPDGAASPAPLEIKILRSGDTGRNISSQESRITDFLNRVWEQSYSREKQFRGALDMQIFGGCIFGAFYEPALEREGLVPISVRVIDPGSFFPAWDPINYDLIKAIVAYQVSSLQAEALGVKIDGMYGTYYEMWDNDAYEISIDGKPVKWNGMTASGKTPAGKIPYVYIAHPPRLGFYGTSLIADKLGLAREINARMADIGDIVSEEAMNVPAVWNTRNPEIKRINEAKVVLDLGIQGGDREPGIQYPTTRGISAQNSYEYVERLLNLARSEAYCPPVIFGNDEGSQRSAASLVARAMTLIAHIREERAAFANGMAKLNRIILNIAVEKGFANFSDTYLNDISVKTNWFPMFPRDSMEEIASIISRVQAGILSPETAIGKIGDVIDIQGELDRIEEWNVKKQGFPRSTSNPYAGAGRSGEFGGLSYFNTKETQDE